MAQILSIYGLVTSVIISNDLMEKMALHTGFLQLGAGLAVGLCGLAAGFAIGIVGDAGGKPKKHKTCENIIFRPSNTQGVSSSKRAAATYIHSHGPDSDLLRGAGTIRSYCGYLDAFEVNCGGDCLQILGNEYFWFGSRVDHVAVGRGN